MKFTVDGKALLSAVSKLNKITKSNEIIIAGGSKHLICKITDGSSLALCKLPAEIEKPGKFTIYKATLEGIYRGRGKITATIKNNQLSFVATGSSYSGKDITLLPEPEEEIEFSKGSKAICDESLQNSLLIQLAAAAINPTYGDDSVALHIAVKDKKLIVAGADRLHAAITTLDLKDDFKLKPLVIPSEYAALLPTFSAKGLSIEVDSNNIVFQNNELYASMPALQVGTIPFDAIVQMASGKTKPQCSCHIDGSEMSAALQNLQVVHESGAGTIIEVKDDKLYMSYRTSYGSTTDAIAASEVKGKMRMVLETDNLTDLLSKISGKLNVYFYGDGTAEFKKKLADKLYIRYFVSALSEQEEKEVKQAKSKKQKVLENA